MEILIILSSHASTIENMYFTWWDKHTRLLTKYLERLSCLLPDFEEGKRVRNTVFASLCFRVGVWSSPLRQASSVSPASSPYTRGPWGATGIPGLVRKERLRRWTGALRVRLRQRPLPVSADPSGGPPRASVISGGPLPADCIFELQVPAGLTVNF